MGLGDALNHIGRKAIIVLRERSLGPVFGIQGGAAGGGHAQVVPMEYINLHFTGDFSAIAVVELCEQPAALRWIYEDQDINIREVRLAAGAEFLVMVCGDIMTMPGLPKVPSSDRVDWVEGRVVGLF